jgi:hypothetical protein
MKSKIEKLDFSMSEDFYRRVFLLINISAVLYAVVGGALMLSAAFGVLNFMAGWPLLSIFLFFFLLWALVYEAYSAATLFLLPAVRRSTGRLPDLCRSACMGEARRQGSP